jgi:endonuclease/exonuclease/phosphatase family metal-dependent hydrolase
MFKNKNRILIYINTHFDFDAAVQTKSAKLIMERLSHLPPEPPVILMGDFNATPYYPCYMIFTGGDQKLKATNRLYFKNMFKEPRGGIIPQECKIIYDTIDGVYPSDHYPLYAKFKWEKDEIGGRRFAAGSGFSNKLLGSHLCEGSLNDDALRSLTILYLTIPL